MTEVRLAEDVTVELSPQRQELLELLLEEAAAEEPEAFPLSPQQRGMWLAARMAPDDPAYVIALALRLTGRLDPTALRRALAEVVRRHESLRLRFSVVEGEPVQFPEPRLDVPLPLVDLRAVPEGARAVEAHRLGDDDGRQVFDLERGPILRAKLLRTGEDEHSVLFAVHHLVSDAWSMSVLVREVGVLYAAFSQGRPSPLPELPIQYLDWVEWQREHLGGEILDRQLSWWRQRLAGAPDLDLPTDHRRREGGGFSGASRPMEPPEVSMADFRRLCQRHGSTPFMVLLAVFYTLLHRISGGDDLVVGTAVANRPRSELEELIGLFVNTLALRADLSGDPSFRELVSRVKAGTLEAFARQDLPFDRLVAELGLRRTPGRSPLFQVFFQVQNAPVSALELPGLFLSGVEREKETAEFDLVVNLRDTPDAVLGEWTFRTDLFDPASVIALARRFGVLLAAAVACEDRPLSELTLLNGPERHQLLAEWNDTAMELPRQDLATLFAAQAARHPGAVAVSFAGGDLTYAELDRRSSRLARRLTAAGVGPEVRVAILARRSAAFVVGVLGIVKAGGAYVPLDPSYPVERLAWMVSDCGARVLLADPDLTDGPSVPLRIELGADPAEAEGPEPVSPPGDALAYVMYTSGSTGRPKGVGVTHRNIVRLVRDSGFAELGPDQVFLQLAPTSFDASTLEIWAPLLNGGRLAVMPPRQPSLEELEQAVSRFGVTSMWLTAGLFHQVVESRLDLLRPLRQLLAGGDVLSPPHVRRALSSLPETTLINGYGPTEGTTFTCCFNLTQGRPWGASVPIGRPIGNTRVYVLGPDLREVPSGVWGELFAGGDGVSRGYLARADLTAERFIPDPFAIPGQKGSRLYRTGDVVRFLADGRIEFRGRRDRQIKLRGFRIELGEIEAALRGHPEVREAVVIVRDEGEDGRRLAAYFVGEAAAEELRSHLKRSLPDYMIPAFFMPLEALPLTPNGKLDLRALPDPERTGSSTEHVAPRDPVEKALAAIWVPLLKIERVGVHDDFFELGGHSLMATRVLAAVRDAFGVNLPLLALFEKPTVAELALAVMEARAGLGTAQASPDRIPHLPRDTDRFPVSASQLREWLLERLLPGAGAYNIPGGGRIVGVFEPHSLGLALREIVRRHESLRTTFAEAGGEGGEPVQVIAADLNLPVPLHDLSALPAEVRAVEVERLSREEAAAPFDLARGPLLRVRLLRLAQGEHLLLFTLHHIVSDGWSMGVFFRELAALYSAFLQGRPSPLPELPVQYADFAVWQRRRLEGESFGRQLDYWRDRLAGLPALELATDRPRPPVQRFAGAKQTFTLAPEVSADLKTFAQRQGVSLFMALLAGFGGLLCRYSGQDDFAVGTYAGNRERAELEGLIGFFINSLVLCLRPAGEASFRELAELAREAALGAFAHQDVPFERVLEALRVERDLSRTPLFQVMLILQNFPFTAVEVPGARLEPVAVSNDHSDFDLSLWLGEGPDGLNGYFSYSVHLFDRATIARLGSHFQVLLRGAIADPDRSLRDLPLLSEPERRQVFDWSAGPPAAPAVQRVEAMFAERARSAPNTTALEWDGGRLTYADLDRRAEVLAELLRRLGVGPEVLVGLAASRSPEMVVGLLAVLRAGGAYLPLDPAYPQARLAWMIEDSGVSVILTQAAVAASLPPSAAEIVLLDAEAATRAGTSPAPTSATHENVGAGLVPARVAEALSDSHPAYVIYTSGSTGNPKGVVVEHRSLSAYTVGAIEAFGMTPEDRVLQFASISFDTSGEEIYPTLASGATLVLRPDDMAASISHFLREVERLRITVLDLPTAFWHELVAALATEGPFPACVRLVILGGEKALPERVALWRRQVGPSVRLLNTYGPTEATIVCTRRDLTEGPDEAPIGRPIAGARAHVLHRWGTQVPVGVPGELHVGGAGLARGYLRRPEITAERFVPDPFGPAGSRLYRTGDLVRWLPSGDLEFLGRVDHQVKLRGFRVELGEIEAALRSHPAVRDIAVALLSGPGGDPRLVGYTVYERTERTAGAETADVADLRAFLRARLPEFMIPAVFVELPALPLTPSGKVDRRSLPAPDAARPEVAARFEAPRTELERTIAGVWRELLGVEQVGLHDNFFELGAHSLLMVRAHARLRQALNRELSVVDLFRHSSVGALARHLSREEDKPTFQEVKALAQQQKAAHGRQRQAMERLRKTGKRPKE